MLVCRTGRDRRCGGIADTPDAPSRRPRPSSAACAASACSSCGSAILLVLFVIARERALPPPLAGVVPLRGGAGGGAHARALPMVVSVTLARGAMRMADEEGHREAALRRCTTWAAWTCSAPTRPGTLTEAQIRLEQPRGCAGARQRARARPRLSQQLISRPDSGARSTTRSSSTPRSTSRAWRKIDEVPFDFERRRVSVLARTTGERSASWSSRARPKTC